MGAKNINTPAAGIRCRCTVFVGRTAGFQWSALDRTVGSQCTVVVGVRECTADCLACTAD